MKNLNVYQKLILLTGTVAIVALCIVNPPQRYRTENQLRYFDENMDIIEKPIPDYRSSVDLSICIFFATILATAAAAGERKVKE